MERIEVITSAQRCRRYSGEEQARFVALTMQPGSSVSSIFQTVCHLTKFAV
ncbi:hypothetical protein ACX1N5_13715 [Acinetobacter sp. ANC 4636]